MHVAHGYKVKERGVALYLSVLLLAVILAMVLGTSAVFLSQLRVLKDLGNSVLAYYAAETGVERTLKNIAGCPPCTDIASCAPCFQETLDNESSYTAWVWDKSICPGSAISYCVKSIGVFRDVRRGLRLTR